MIAQPKIHTPRISRPPRTLKPPPPPARKSAPAGPPPAARTGMPPAKLPAALPQPEEGPHQPKGHARRGQTSRPARGAVVEPISPGEKIENQTKEELALGHIGKRHRYSETALKLFVVPFLWYYTSVCQ
eukprot:gene545-296_t